MSRAPLQTNTPIPSFKTTRKSKLTHFSVASIVSLLAFISILVIVGHAIIAWNVAVPYVPPLESKPNHKKELSYEVLAYPRRSGNTTVDSWFIPARSAASGKESGQTIILTH